MRITEKLVTEFGELDVYLCATNAKIASIRHYPTNCEFSAVTIGDVRINRVDYRLRIEWLLTSDHGWKDRYVNLDRKDNKDAQWPRLARQKVQESIEKVLPNILNRHLLLAKEEAREKQIEQTKAQINEKTKEIAELNALLETLYQRVA